MRKFLAVIMIWAGLSACSDDKDVLVSIPNDVTMNELELGRFRFRMAVLLRKLLIQME